MSTKEEIARLKSEWQIDPIFDIEDTPGFEEHHDELLEFRKTMEAKWEEGRKIRLLERANDLGLSPAEAEFLRSPREIERALDVDAEVGEVVSAMKYAQFIIAREQVRATLALAAQVKRIADHLEAGETIDLWSGNY